MTSAMNEAEFESRVVRELHQLFPSLEPLQLSIQKVLSLRLGHRTVSIDGSPSERLHGRFDVLVSIRNRPSLLFEHKRPGSKLTNDDRDQAISYARLLTPMPPLCVVTNGADVAFYKTIDKTQWSSHSLDEAIIEDLIQEGLEIAASDLDDAVCRLLGRDASVWKPIVAEFTRENVEEITGEISDITRPVSRAFQIPRKSVHQAIEIIVGGKQLIAVTGPPLSGKTNVLVQLAEACERIGLAPLYLDFSDATTGILRTVANMFSTKLFRSRTSDDVRSWLSLGLRSASTAKLVFLVDGWNAADGEQAKESLHELIRICYDAHVAIVLAVDDATWSRIAFRPGRTERTRIGRLALTVPVAPLDENECQQLEPLTLAQGVAFHEGWASNPEFRNPRILRLEVAEASRGVTSLPYASDDGTLPVRAMPPVSTIQLLVNTGEQYFSQPELRADYKEFAKLVLEELSASLSPEMALFGFRRGVVRREMARLRLGERLGAMISTGHLRDADSPRDPVVIPTLPELVSTATVPFISDELTKLIRNDQLDAAVEALLQYAKQLPVGELAAALSLTKVPPDVFTPLVLKLLELRPSSTTLPAGTKVLMQFGNEQFERTLTAEDVTEGGGIDNLWPALILSHLAGHLGVLGADGVMDTGINLAIWRDFGSFSHPMLPLAIGNIRAYHAHDFEAGSILCFDEGMIEPITWSMQCAFHSEAHDMSALAKKTVTADRIFLALRLHHAASVAATATKASTQERAQQVRTILDPYVRARLGSSADGLVATNSDIPE